MGMRWTKTGVFGLWLVSALLSALFLSWKLLAANDFLYPTFYDWAGIEATIAEYAPQNRYRDGFEQTTRAERERLFAAIGDAIHEKGRGLESLAYHDAQGRPLAPLLHQQEITHLRDVARLVAGFSRAGWLALATLALTTLALWRLHWPIPRPKRLLGGTVLAGVGLGLSLAAIGPTRVFYTLHEWLFPPDHPWFFYYQDSLMSTMMRAPVLFGYIGAALAILAAVILSAMLAGIYTVNRHARKNRAG